jgi:hypothetical protein
MQESSIDWLNLELSLGMKPAGKSCVSPPATHFNSLPRIWAMEAAEAET